MPDRLPYRYDDLTPLGKAVHAAGATARGAGTLLERLLARAADLYVETERAFKEGRDGPVDDAEVVRERRRPE